MTLASFLSPSSYIKSHLLSTVRYNCGQASIQHPRVFVSHLLISHDRHKTIADDGILYAVFGSFMCMQVAVY